MFVLFAVQDFAKVADSVGFLLGWEPFVAVKVEVEEKAAIDQCAISRFVFLSCQIGKSNLFH